jgi:hypothetical protein
MQRSQERFAFGRHEGCFREDALAKALRVERTDLVLRADCYEGQAQVAKSIEEGRVVDDLVVERANIVRKEIVNRVEQRWQRRRRWRWRRASKSSSLPWCCGGTGAGGE